jgi:5'-deoxynucleotidase YfbR-like HD superfamily hydrolase
MKAGMGRDENATGLQAAPRAWQRMLSGRRLDLLDPRPQDIEIGDIAQGLARVARWNGQTTGEHAFSVAQHALVVEEIFSACQPGAEPPARLAALLHDAPEYVVGDLISPFKAAVGLNYKAFETRLLEAIHRRFGIGPLPADVSAAIKAADHVAAYYEATLLAGFGPQEGERYFGKPVGLPAALRTRLESLVPWPTGQAQARFLKRFAELAGG